MDKDKASKWSSTLGGIVLLLLVLFVFIPMLKDTWKERQAKDEIRAVLERPYVAPSQGQPQPVEVRKNYGRKFNRPTEGTRFSPRIIILGTNTVYMRINGITDWVVPLIPSSDPNFTPMYVGGQNGVQWRYFELCTKGSTEHVLLYYE